MTLEEAINAAREALSHWGEYLEENDREEECERFDAAADALDAFVQLITRGPK